MSSSKRLNRRAKITFANLKSGIRKLIPILVLIPVIILSLSLLSIKKINCTLNGASCPDQVMVVFDKLEGTNSLFINQKELFTFLKAVYPVDKMSISFHAFNTLDVKLVGNSPFVLVDTYLVNEMPVLSMDQAPSTTDSAGWWVRPTGEIKTYLSNKTAQGFSFWENGSMTPEATSGSIISYVFTDKPSQETISSIYKLTKQVSKYLDVSNIYIINNRCFLSMSGQPDIIIGVPFDEAFLTQALQSMNYLVTIKKDAKVIDLSFKNPIIR